MFELSRKRDPKQEARIGRGVGAVSSFLGLVSVIMALNPAEVTLELAAAGAAGLVVLATSVWVLGGVAGRALGGRSLWGSVWIWPLVSLLSFFLLVVVASLTAFLVGAARGPEDTATLAASYFGQFVWLLVFGAIPAALFGLPWGIIAWRFIHAEEESGPSGPPGFQEKG